MELAIHACEGGFYLAKLHEEKLSDKDLQNTCRKHGINYKPATKFHSLAHIRDLFGPLAPQAVWLVHNHAYDEMIGLATSAAEHKQPLHWYSDGFNEQAAQSA